MTLSKEPPTPDPAAVQRDLELVRAVREAEPGSAEAIAERLKCVPRILSVINGRRGSRLSTHDLEDLGQDALIKIWKKLDAYVGQATFENWLYRFCFLEYMNRVRHKSRASHVAGSSLDELERQPEVAPTRSVRLEYEDIEGSLVRLGPPESDVIRLKHFEQLTFEGVAKALGVSAKVAKTRYYRGIAWLQRDLRVHLQEG